MVFSSLIFTFVFLPIVIALNYIAKDKYRNYILLIASIAFYSYGEPQFVFVMLGSIMVNYLVSMAIDKRKTLGMLNQAKVILSLGIIINIGILFVFKYLDFSINLVNDICHLGVETTGILLPIGISFFTFQALSYIIDVYRGTVQVQKNPLFVALYISFFPQLIAGPIVRYSTIEDQIISRTCTLEKFSNGGRRFFIGFIKKIILANNLAVVANESFSQNLNNSNPLLLWMGAICFTLQIYYDFSGYSDMAIGLGQIFGFEFLENFDYPYMSKSVTEFWRRWHISLGQWFRDYIYIPLGGSRVSIGKHLFNMFIVWFLTGLWHGANYTFVVWGMLFFFMLVIEKYIIKPEKIKNKFLSSVWRIVTLMIIVFGWVIFNSPSLKYGLSYFMAMFGGNGIRPVVDGTLCRYIREYGLFMVFGLIFATPVARFIKNKIDKSENVFLGYVIAIVAPVCYGFLFLWAVSFIILGAHNPFIYFNF